MWPIEFELIWKANIQSYLSWKEHDIIIRERERERGNGRNRLDSVVECRQTSMQEWWMRNSRVETYPNISLCLADKAHISRVLLVVVFRWEFDSFIWLSRWPIWFIFELGQSNLDEQPLIISKSSVHHLIDHCRLSSSPFNWTSLDEDKEIYYIHILGSQRDG